MADLNSPGHFALELHTDYMFTGRSFPAYAGEVPTDHATRLTLESSFGMTDWLEASGPDSRPAPLSATVKTILGREL